MQTTDTAIIGGGIAGLACARHLCDGGADFLLITDRLGGRLFAGPEPTANLGACYMMADYRHVGRCIARGARLRLRDIYFPDGDRFVALWHFRSRRHWRALFRLYRQAKVFRDHVNRLYAAIPEIGQAQALSRDPLLTDYTQQPASEFIRRHGLQEVDEIFAGPVVNSTVFAPSTAVNTFYYLASLQPLASPTYLMDFSRTVAKLTAGYRQQIRRGRVEQLQETSDGFCLSTTDGLVQARNVVVATPCHNTRQFCPALDRAAVDGVREIPMCTLHVRGRRRPRYRPGKTMFFRPGEPATVLVTLPDAGCDLLYSRTREPDLSIYYESFEVLRSVEWKTAIQLSYAAWRPLCPRPRLFTIGDYNVSGLEASYLTGVYAANRILESTVQSSPYRSRPGLTGSPVKCV